MTSVKGLWKKPYPLGEKVRIIDPEHKRYGQEGYKQASRPDGKVMVYFPMTEKTGTYNQLDWEQCKRV